MKKSFGFAFFSLLGAFAVLEAIPPAPLQNYCPVVILNNTNVTSPIYLVITGLDPYGVPCFLKPNTTTGVCSYVYPQLSGSNGSVVNSVEVSQLPTATNTGLSGTANLFYLPECTSGRAYYSIGKPLYLSTSYSASSGLVAINSPSLVSLNDPNYYVAYQDFEFGLGPSAVDSSTLLYINVSNVDTFCIPMGLSTYSYSGTGNDVPISSDITPIAGYPSGSTQTSLMADFVGKLNTYKSTWGHLPVQYYANPYTSDTSSGVFRILSVKNSVALPTGRQFSGGAFTLKSFPSNYVDNLATGPVSGKTYMEAVYSYYSTNPPLWSVITPAAGHILYSVTASATPGQLDFTAYEATSPYTPIPADDTYLQLYTLSVENLFSGAIDFANGFDNKSAIGAELGKLISTLFCSGNLYFYKFATSKSNPFYNAKDLLINKQNYGYAVQLDYFVNPPTYTGGPWYNYYDAVIHPYESSKNLLALNPSLGQGYAYDYDDAMGIDGTQSGVTVQNSQGNPASTKGSSNPYAVMELLDMTAAVIPSLSDPYYYNVTFGSAPNGATVTFYYQGGSTAAVYNADSAAIPIYGQNAISLPDTSYLYATFTFNGISYSFDINLLGQVVIPRTGTVFNEGSVQYQQGFTFTKTGGGDGSSAGTAIDISIIFNSSPTPW